MLYLCGSNLESISALATFNLYQALDAEFSKSGDVRMVVMTGGSLDWFVKSKYLYDPVNHEEITTISTKYNQIWELYGSDA